MDERASMQMYHLVSVFDGSIAFVDGEHLGQSLSPCMSDNRAKDN